MNHISRRNGLGWPTEASFMTTRRKRLYLYLILLTHGIANTSFKHTHSCSAAGISAVAYRPGEVQSEHIYHAPRREDSKMMLKNAGFNLNHPTHQRGTPFRTAMNLYAGMCVHIYYCLILLPVNAI